MERETKRKDDEKKKAGRGKGSKDGEMWVEDGLQDQDQTQNPLYLSMSVSREESRNPLANGLLSIFSLVIWRTADIQYFTLFLTLTFFYPSCVLFSLNSSQK